MQIRRKLAAIATVSAVSVALAAGVPALASSRPAASTAVTGPEVIAGAVHGKKALANATIIPLTWRGLVNTHSRINLGGKGPHKGSSLTLKTPAGKFAIKVTRKPQSRQAFNGKTCRFSFTEDIVITVVGSKSSGKFAGASGPGAVQVAFAETAPRFKSGPNKGKCNPNGKPIAKTAVASFLASVVLTIK
jgi:hypothetical protein